MARKETEVTSLQFEEPILLKQWETKDINPQEISVALGGTLEKSLDGESKWTIRLRYGRKDPLLVLKLDPEERAILVTVPTGLTPDSYRLTLKLYNVERLGFLQYRVKGKR